MHAHTIADYQTLNHPLDHVIWSALHARHAELALGSYPALRYPPAYAPFAAMADVSAASYTALAGLLVPHERVALFTMQPLTPPSEFHIEFQKPMVQMLGLAVPDPTGQLPLESLGLAQLDEMLALIEIAKPGPFSARTPELGAYLGVRIDGRLAAMAGERMRLDGYTEISAVCAHPDYRGRGLPAELIKTLAQSIRARGDIPFLHVLRENETALGLYRKLGFIERRPIDLTVMGLASS